jgi:hypothetical protein
VENQKFVKIILNFVDLAGPEWIEKSKTSEARLSESLMINKILNIFKLVLTVLVRGLTSTCRNCLLTLFFKSSLCGSSYTLMLACICLAISIKTESLDTLNFAEKARAVKITRRNITLTKQKINKVKEEPFKKANEGITIEYSRSPLQESIKIKSNDCQTSV